MAPLFPLDAAAAYEAWREQFVAHEEQQARLSGPPPEDTWAPLVERFSPSDHAPEGFERFVELIGEDGSVLDIGAGGGRWSVPLAARVAQVTAVDPSEAMTAALQQHAAALANLEVLPTMSWPPPDASTVPSVDVVFNSHVIYFVDDIAAFLDAMEHHATRRCVVIAGERSGGAPPPDAFEAVHGEPLVESPACNELVSVLAARGAEYEVERIDTAERRLVGDPVALLRRRCYVTEGSDEEARLRDWLAGRDTPGERAMSSLAMIAWEPPR